MWLLAFAAVAQGALVGERVLNRVVKLVVPSTRTPTKELADKMVVGAFFSHASSAVFALIATVAQAHVLLLQNAAVIAGVVVLTGVLALLSDSSGFIYVSVYNTYNSGLGYIIYAGFLVPLRLADAVLGSLLPLYNLAMFITKNFLMATLWPMLQLNVEQLPALVQNTGFFFSACAVSVVELVANVIECMGVSNVERLFWTATERAARVVSARFACLLRARAARVLVALLPVSLALLPVSLALRARSTAISCMSMRA